MTAIPTKDNTGSISSNDESEDASPADSSDFDSNLISISPKTLEHQTESDW